MADEPKPALIYAGASDAQGAPRFRIGVPRRDLTAEEVAALDPALLKDITGGDQPMYAKPGTKAGKAAAAEAGDKE